MSEETNYRKETGPPENQDEVLERRLTLFEALVWKVCFVLAMLSIIFAFLVWRTFGIGFFVGGFLGCWSFRILVNSFKPVIGKNPKMMKKALQASGGKAIGILIVSYGFFRLGVNMLQILFGLFYSQLAIIFAALYFFRTPAMLMRKPQHARN